ncbi:4-hydroxy-tetrahydrodipicolinate reductase [Marinilactibacillus kalidii]|uniref:4-hydroxy-tetrahydrodipicolinate reductase n=1 Tax=Marinilactibacillus kalidii TaxID=2820274 RepID=UPI001ABE2965|nr:4-hydroxy-tetrahydrodipicolinate reductase [Marinilactibacillus kalidii]
MDILLVGYGAMNKRVASLAEEKGHRIAGVVTPDASADHYPVFSGFNENLPAVDVVIDFSHPVLTTALLESNISAPLVIATTGEKEQLAVLMQEKAQTQPVFFSANMSYGVHILTEIIKYATPLLETFDIEMIEKHHNQKVDAPSGTLVKLYDAIVESAKPNATPVYDRHEVSEKRDSKDIGISSIRGGTIVGEHEVIYAGHDEVISIKHTAQSKDIFASGALTVAEALQTKPQGYYTYHNLGE